MRVEQLIHGLFNGVGYQTLETPNLRNVANDYIVSYLMKLKKSKQMRWKEEDLVTVSYVKKVSDEYGRQGYFNHSFVMTQDDYFEWTQPRKLLDHHFRKDLKSPPTQLEPLEVT